MIVNRKVDRLLILVLPLVFVVYLSTRPTYQLQEEPPPEFLRAQSDWPPKRRAAEEQLARAYWKCAVNVIAGAVTALRVSAHLGDQALSVRGRRGVGRHAQGRRPSARGG